MARKPARADGALPIPLATSRRARSEITFEDQRLLGPLFGQFDANLVQVENRLGVFISARGDRVQIEGSEDSVARARDTLKAMYDRLALGQELDAGAINFNGSIALADVAPFVGEAFYEDANKHNFRYINNVEPRNEQENVNLSLKGDWDVGITLDVMDAADHVDEVVLASGDGDFDMLLERIISKHRVEAVAYGVPGLTANSLIRAASRYVPIEGALLLKN